MATLRRLVALCCCTRVASFVPTAFFGRKCASVAHEPSTRWITPAMTSTEEKTETQAKSVVAGTDKDKFPILTNIDPEDTGLKVTPAAWKWPVVWPYGPDYFERDDTADDAEFYAKPRLEEAIDEAARVQLSEHYGRFLRDGMAVLEIGASAHSYFPEQLKLSSVVGVGISEEEMKANKALTKRIARDLNVDADLPLEDSAFDASIIANSIEFFTDPRGVLREVFRTLRPGGICMIAFSGKSAYADMDKKKIKMWKTMNDAQHMWIVGSYFRFSAGDGWLSLKGYDVSPEEAKSMMGGFSGQSSVFLVQARKAPAAAKDDLVGQMREQLYTAPQLDSEDVEYCTLRLMAAHKRAESDEQRRAVMECLPRIAGVYEVLAEMKAGVLFPPYKALLASRLAPRWTGSEAQVGALREGLGLVPAQDAVWKHVGQNTRLIMPEDRVILLSDLVPLFDGTPDEQAALLELKEVLPQAVAAIKATAPRISPTDQELLAADLITTDYLTADKGGRDSFIDWLKGVERETLETWLVARKSYKAIAKGEDPSAPPAAAAAAAGTEEAGAASADV